MQGAAIFTVMWDFVSGLGPVPPILIGSLLVLALIASVKRGSGV